MNSFSYQKLGFLCFSGYLLLLVALALPGWERPPLIRGKFVGLVSVHGSALPSVGGFPAPLDSSDAQAMRTAFDAQQQQDWAAADSALASLNNRLLAGELLAERYLSRHYAPTAEELSAWLQRYRDLPQAHHIYLLASTRYGVTEPVIAKPDLIPLRGDDAGLAGSSSDSTTAETWREAIAAYQQGHYARAVGIFDRMLEARDSLPAWKRSAVGFWAWRAHLLLDEKDKASAALLIAASEPRSFYGILARKQLRQPLGVQEEPLALSEEDISALQPYDAVQRALALVQVGRSDLAEQNLRALYSRVPSEERFALLCLAHQLSLPALQITLAKRLGTKENPLDIAKYPIPDWEPAGGFSVDPSLIYALVRQESGFRNTAISPAGAMGLMQLMPGTAHMMSKQLGLTANTRMSDAERNITLGQSYVRHLLEQDLVDHNMIYMLTAYNAGIRRLQEWKGRLDYRNDPLLFIETMPYPETRYYVMQVMTNYWLYNELLGVPSPSLASLASNQWPIYTAPEMAG